MIPKIVLCVVENRETILLEYAKWLTVTVMGKKVYGVLFHKGKRKNIWLERKNMIEHALTKDCTHILFVDTDVIPPKDGIERLWGLGADIATGIYYDTEGKPCSKKDGEWFYGEHIQKVDIGAMGYSLIRREVFEKVQYPEPDPRGKLDSDDQFFKACKKAGYKIVQDFNNRAAHLLIGAF